MYNAFSCLFKVFIKFITVAQSCTFILVVIMVHSEQKHTHQLMAIFHCHSLSLAQVNPDWFYLPGFTVPFWYRLTWVVPDTVQGAVKQL